MNELKIKGLFVQSEYDTPTRIGERVETESEIANIKTPYRGMIIYIADQDSFVYVKTLKSSYWGSIEIKNALVDEYVPLQTGGTVTLNWNDVV